MAIPRQFDGRLAAPIIAAPMFLTSGPELVAEACKAGAIGAFPANFLTKSLIRAGLDPADLPARSRIDMAEELDTESKAWKDIWSASQGCGTIDDVPTVAELCRRLTDEYRAAIAAITARHTARAAE